MTDYEPYVAEPAEPAPRRRLAGAAPVVWSLAVVVALACLATLFLTGRGQEDPALSVPSEQATEQPQRD